MARSLRRLPLPFAHVLRHVEAAVRARCAVQDSIATGIKKELPIGTTLGYNTEDFAGAWIPWMRKAVEEDKIELHLFQMPDFLKDVADKVVLHAQTDAATFPATVAAIGPDFYLAPLADTPFNRAKSNLKLLEASAVGAVLLGSSFLWSPYEEAYPLAKVTPDDTPESLARLFDNLCTPTHYNAAQAWQRTMMDEKHYWMDDLRYISRWLRTFFGDTIQAHF